MTEPHRAPVWVGTSWKMTKTRAAARAWTVEVLAGLAERGHDGVRPFVLPPLTALAEVADAARRAEGPAHPLLVGAQNAHWEDEGPWTGEVAVGQVADAGARLVEVGHSERREHFGESDEVVARKVRAVLRHGLVPVLCVGEPAEVRDAGRHVEHVTAQVDAALAGVADPAPVLLAYEPVWAIGAGGRPATPEDVDPVVSALGQRWGSAVEAVLYGGSVDPDNAAGLLEVPGVGGLFAGRSAWTAAGFLALVDVAARHGSAGQPIGSSGP